MGFPNPGAEIACERVRAHAGRTVVGLNIGKTKLVEPDGVIDDYVKSTRLLAPVSDYIVINVSSPNTPGLTKMQAIELLRPLIAAVREAVYAEALSTPILIKIGPDLSDSEIDEIAELSMEMKIDGIVAVNTTTDTACLSPGALLAFGEVTGGISGVPLKPRAIEVLGRLRARVSDEIVLISVGGIDSADDVWDRILAGATLVQAHTGFIYGGPLWPSRINAEIARRVRAAGKTSIAELVGTNAKPDADFGLSAPPKVLAQAESAASAAMHSENATNGVSKQRRLARRKAVRRQSQGSAT
jgi:dihydroorotate dehydrogenase